MILCRVRVFINDAGREVCMDSEERITDGSNARVARLRNVGSRS